MREAILSLSEDAWRPAIRQDGTERDGALIAEITNIERLDLTPWPDGSRVIIRCERPHPGAQLTFTDHEGHRFQATLTELDGDAVEIECLHRGRANAESHPRRQADGDREPPLPRVRSERVWLELSMIAQDLIAWTQNLCLQGKLAICEPKALSARIAELLTEAERSRRSATGSAPQVKVPRRRSAARERSATRSDRAAPTR